MYYIIYNILATKANELSEMGYLAFAFFLGKAPIDSPTVAQKKIAWAIYATLTVN